MEPQASRDACDQDTRYRYRYYLTPTCGVEAAREELSLVELARVIKAGLCIEASFKRGKGEVGMDEYQVRTWEGWHHHMAVSLIAVWFLIGETHQGQQLTPALTLPQVRYGLSMSGTRQDGQAGTTLRSKRARRSSPDCAEPRTEPTPHSVRSCVAPAMGRGSPRALRMPSSLHNLGYETKQTK